MTITIQIGSTETIYHLRYTNAPKAYDGFGTIELSAYDGGKEFGGWKRVVLIADEHLNWQEMRYVSGNYFTDSAEADQMLRAYPEHVIVRRLQLRLLQQDENG